MELVLDRSLSERRIFPAIDIYKSGTRRDDLLLTAEEMGVAYNIRKDLSRNHSSEVMESMLQSMVKAKSNAEFVDKMKRNM